MTNGSHEKVKKTIVFDRLLALAPVETKNFSSALKIKVLKTVFTKRSFE
jgi:hypothetical protein